MKKLKLDQLGRHSVETFQQADKINVTVLLDNVRSMHNVGAAFRTGDAFKVKHILLTGITGQPPHREISKTALGATESVAWSYKEDVVEAVKELKQEGYRIILIEQTDQSIALDGFHPEPNESYCLVFGNEVAGVSEGLLDLADTALEIPQEGTKHSLNVSVCLGVVLWEFYKVLK